MSNQNKKAKCTRCKNIHNQKDRVEKYNKKSGMTDLVCPRCDGKSFYRVEEVKVDNNESV